MRLLMRRPKIRKATRMNGRYSNSELSKRSLADYQNTIKKFWRWLKTPPDAKIEASWNPPETAWIKTVAPEKNVLREDILRPSHTKNETSPSDTGSMSYGVYDTCAKFLIVTSSAGQSTNRE
jgi:hypothetical protein